MVKTTLTEGSPAMDAGAALAGLPLFSSLAASSLPYPPSEL